MYAHLAQCYHVEEWVRSQNQLELWMRYQSYVDGKGHIRKFNTHLPNTRTVPAQALLTTSSFQSGEANVDLEGQALSAVALQDPWTSERPKDFARDFLRLLVSINAAFVAAENPFLLHFFARWVPGSIVPSRQAVASEILDNEAERVMKEMQQALEGKYGTGQVDGWKNIAKVSLVGAKNR